VTVGKHDGELTYCGLLPDRSGLTRVEHDGLSGLRLQAGRALPGKDGRIRRSFPFGLPARWPHIVGIGRSSAVGRYATSAAFSATPK
jgi:hypothetical protein